MDKNLHANAGDTGIHPWSGKIPHPKVQLSLCAQLLSQLAASTAAHVPRALALQQEEPPSKEAHALQLERCPRSWKREEAHAQQQKPSAAKNK